MTWLSYAARQNACFGPSSIRKNEEIEGIVSRVRARLPRLNYDRVDITVLNGWIELAWYYVPCLDELAGKGDGDNNIPLGASCHLYSVYAIVSE